MDPTPENIPAMPGMTDAQGAAPVVPDLLGDMIAAESEEVDWTFVRHALESHVKAHFEREIRLARERLREIHAATAPYLIKDE